MVDTDPTTPLAVETMDDQAFAMLQSGRQAAVAALSTSMEFYAAKKMLLVQAVQAEKNAAETLRTFAAVTVTEGAAGQELTVERRTGTLVRLRRNLFAARQLLAFVKSKSSMSFLFPPSIKFLFLSRNRERVRDRLQSIQWSWHGRPHLSRTEKDFGRRMQEEARGGGVKGLGHC